MNYPLTKQEEKLEKHFNRVKAKNETRLIKLKNERDNKVDSFGDYTSHNLKEFIQTSEFINVNKILKKHIYKNNTLEHERTKARLFTELLWHGHDIILEPQLLDKSLGRPDVLQLDCIPAIAYEVVCSEKESSLINKDVKYPFKIVKIKVGESK